MILEQVRDLWTNTSTYFWSKNNSVISPYFDSVREAEIWLAEHISDNKDKSDI